MLSARIRSGERISFTYTNHREETSRRLVLFLGIHVTGSATEAFYPPGTWTLHTFDLDKKEYRDFAIERIHPGTLRAAP